MPSFYLSPSPEDDFGFNAIEPCLSTSEYSSSSLSHLVPLPDTKWNRPSPTYWHEKPTNSEEVESSCDTEESSLLSESSFGSDIVFSHPVLGSDIECWEHMLALHKEYRCYRSARIEAAVEAEEQEMEGVEISIPSRFSLALLNDELETRARVTGVLEQAASYIEIQMQNCKAGEKEHAVRSERISWPKRILLLFAGVVHFMLKAWGRMYLF